LDDSITIVLDNRDILSGICGANDGNLKVIEGSLGGRIAARGNEIRLEGADDDGVRRFRTLMDSLITMVKEGEYPSPEYVRALTGADSPAGEPLLGESSGEEAFIHIPNGFGRVYPKSKNQAAYIRGMRKFDISFGIGPAGTGKTYLAIAQALNLVLSKKMRKLVLTRPVVEAGESLGFLPGDLAQKINPYLRPLYDAMESLVPYDIIHRM
jgi:phosphate starvation-inducible PhoH-like protein